MPDGKTHFEYYTRGWVAILPTSIILSVGINPILGVSTMLGYALGRWIDPDLDQVSITSAEGRILNDFRILGYVVVEPTPTFLLNLSLNLFYIHNLKYQ